MDFITTLPFTLEVWKTICIIFAMIIVVLSKVANKYWRLRNNMDGDIDSLKTEIEQINKNFQMVEKRKEKINELCNILESRKDEIDKIYKKQDEQLENLKKILKLLENSSLYKDIHSNDTDIYTLLKTIAHDYDISKK